MPKAGEKERKRKRHKTAVHYIFYSTRNASEMLLDLPGKTYPGIRPSNSSASSFFSCFSVALKKFAPLHFPASAVLHVSSRRAKRVTAAALGFKPPPKLTN